MVWHVPALWMKLYLWHVIFLDQIFVFQAYFYFFPIKNLFFSTHRFRPLLKENNYAPVLGIKYKLVTPGVIKVGDPVYALE